MLENPIVELEMAVSLRGTGSVGQTKSQLGDNGWDVEQVVSLFDEDFVSKDGPSSPAAAPVFIQLSLRDGRELVARQRWVASTRLSRSARVSPHRSVRHSRH